MIKRFLFYLSIVWMLFFTPCFVQAYDNVLIIVEDIGAFPDCIDPVECTAEEQTLIIEWQERFNNAWGLKSKVDKNEFLFQGACTEIIHPEKGVLVTKGGLFGRAYWIKRPRILKDDAWITSKIDTLIANGWELKGWIITNGNKFYSELTARNYVIVSF